jgi:nickel transport protein
MRKTFGSLLALALCGAAATATAHTAWLEPDPRPGVWTLMFGGHQGRLEPVTPSKLKAVTAVDARGRALRVSRSVKGADVRISVAGDPALIALHYDNGIHTRTAKPAPASSGP